jgi:hypothetical protein
MGKLQTLKTLKKYFQKEINCRIKKPTFLKGKSKSAFRTYSI